MAAAQEPADDAHVGVVVDWSHKHVVSSRGLSQRNVELARREPRLVQQLLERHLPAATTPRGQGGPSEIANQPRSRKKGLHVDWAVSLGAGNVPPNMSPAKYGFDANGTPDCNADYAVFGLNVAGVTGGQANMVGLDNLYSGPGGFCAATIAAAPNGVSRSGNVVTVTTTTAHGFSAGVQVTIAGVTDSSFNGTFTITSILGPTRFTYAQTAGNATSGGGTATLQSATFKWAYNGSTAAGSVLTSPSISLDGKRIVYVESTASSSIFHVLTWVEGEGTSATASAAPAMAGTCTPSSSCLVSVTYSASATNSISSPWIDYTNDKAYVGSDDGKIYRISCVFYCPLNTNPSVDWTFTLPVAGTGGPKPVPNGPVLDNLTGRLLVGDSLGELWSINITQNPPVLAASPIMVGGAGCTIANPPNRTGTPSPCTPVGLSYGIVDPVLLDISAGRVFAFSGNDGTNGSPNPTSATVLQATELLASVVRTHVGRGSRSTSGTFANVDLHAGAFDNNYWGASPSTGSLFVCGTATNSSAPWHWKIGFTSYPTMNSSGTAIVARGFSAGNPCTPYTEVYNPNLDINPGVTGAQHDLLVSGVLVPGGTGYVITNDISSGTITAALATNTRPTGTSAFVIDGFSTAGEASSVYFSTLANDTVAPCNGVKCAVKLTQVGLQ